MVCCRCKLPRKGNNNVTSLPRNMCNDRQHLGSTCSMCPVGTTGCKTVPAHDIPTATQPRHALRAYMLHIAAVVRGIANRTVVARQP